MGETNRTRPTIDRFDLETVALLLLDVHARRQLALPKNRAKGVPEEGLERLVRMARAEMFEVLDAIEDGRPSSEILAELGDVAAFVGMAMWRATKDDENAPIPFPTSYVRGIYSDEIERLRSERDAARAEVATWQKVTGFDDVEHLDFFLGRNGVKNHLDVIAKLSADAWNEVARLKSLRMTLEAERDDAIDRAAKAECEIEWLRAAMPRPCTNDHCVGGTHISDNGMRGRCHVCSGKGHICTTRDPNHAAKAVKS